MYLIFTFSPFIWGFQVFLFEIILMFESRRCQIQIRLQIKVNYYEEGSLCKPRSSFIQDKIGTGYKSRSCNECGEELDNEKVEVKDWY